MHFKTAWPEKIVLIWEVVFIKLRDIYDENVRMVSQLTGYGYNIEGSLKVEGPSISGIMCKQLLHLMPIQIFPAADQGRSRW